jgi:diguanylate cyclase (GGDEF)-like protein
MAASNDNDFLDRPRTPRLSRECLSPADLHERLEEEIGRAERHRTPLSCLLLSIDDVERLSDAHGAQLPKRALAYLAATLERQLRRYDRVGCPAEGELLIVLPGADERRGEIVARRALGRLHSVKLELDGVRHPLHISIGITAWQGGLTPNDLLERARLAASAGRRDEQRYPGNPASPSSPAGAPAGDSGVAGDERGEASALERS